MSELNLKSTKQRDYLFDNYKVFLIILVIIGHFIEPCMNNTGFLYTLKWWIFSFHMPAFILISGYFSKKELPFSVVFQKLAVPYIVYEIIYYLFYTFITHKETGLYLLRPKFSLWYLLALFVWRAITPYVKRIPHYMILSFAAGLLIGFSDMPNNFLSIPRILFFYPFFLAGTNLSRDVITRFRTRTVKILSVATVSVITLLFAFGPLFRALTPKIFYGRYNYESLGEEPLEGILIRIMCYIIGFVMTFAFMFIIIERKTIYSYIGTRTMALYLFHGLTYSYLKDCTTLLENVDTAAETVLLIGFCILLAVVFSAAPLTAFTNKVSSLSLPKTGNLHRWMRRRIAYFKWHARKLTPDYWYFYHLLYSTSSKF